MVMVSAFAKAQSQDSTQVEVPRILQKVFVEQAVNIDGEQIVLTEVLEDSRCPKNVECVWAGQAKVVIEITSETGKRLTKEIILKGSPVSLEGSDGTQFVIRGLKPHPKTSQKIDPADYHLLVDIRKTE